MSTEMEFDPEKALWRPSRRGFLSMFIAAAVAPMLPEPGLKAATGSRFTSMKMGDTFTITGFPEVFRVVKVEGSIIRLERDPVGVRVYA